MVGHGELVPNAQRLEPAFDYIRRTPAIRDVLISGGDSGKRLEALLANCGFPVRIVPVVNEIRTNFTITDKHGLTVNLNGAGPQLSKEEAARVEGAVTAALTTRNRRVGVIATPATILSAIAAQVSL